jgi:hypothetical protein
MFYPSMRQPVDRLPHIGTMPSLNWSNFRPSMPPGSKLYPDTLRGTPTAEALQAIVDVYLGTLAPRRVDGPFGCKTKFGPDVGEFLRVHVAPVQGEKAESRKASFAEMDLWHTSADPDLD